MKTLNTEKVVNSNIIRYSLLADTLIGKELKELKNRVVKLILLQVACIHDFMDEIKNELF